MKKRTLIVMLIGVLSMGMLLTACGVKEEADEEEVFVSEENILNKEEIDVNNDKMPSDAVTVQTEVVDSEKEEETVYIPKGVDINSTLSGEEWIASFVDICEEPVLVLFNDTTGRKEVVQNGGEVVIDSPDDKWGIYSSYNGLVSDRHHNMYCPTATHVITPDGKTCLNAKIGDIDYEEMLKVPVKPFPAELVIVGDMEEEWVLKFNIQAE